jgi:hypothetical protein
MGFVIEGSGVATAMRLLVVPLLGLIAVTALAWRRLGTAA